MMTSSTLICIFISTGQEMFCGKFAELQSVITSLFFNRFSSGFTVMFEKFTLSSEIKLNLLWSSS